MEAADKLREVINSILSAVCSLMFALMVIIGTYQIVTRYVFNSPSTVSEELLTYTFAWMALLVSALVFGKREHMRVSFLADKVTGSSKMMLDVVVEILVVAVAVIVLLYGGFTMVQLTMSQKTASLGIPMGMVYAVVPITGALITIYGICNIIDLVTGNVKKSQREAKE